MSQFNAPTYDIERPSGQCTFTGQTLEPGEHYMAVLVEAPQDAPLFNQDAQQADAADTDAAKESKKNEEPDKPATVVPSSRRSISVFTYEGRPIQQLFG